jgi:hypothetical protein
MTTFWKYPKKRGNSVLSPYMKHSISNVKYWSIEPYILFGLHCPNAYGGECMTDKWFWLFRYPYFCNISSHLLYETVVKVSAPCGFVVNKLHIYISIQTILWLSHTPYCEVRLIICSCLTNGIVHPWYGWSSVLGHPPFWWVISTFLQFHHLFVLQDIPLLLSPLLVFYFLLFYFRNSWYFWISWLWWVSCILFH